MHTSPTEYPQAALRGVLNALPGKFGLPRTEFYRPCGPNTASGIVFVTTVNARVHGMPVARDVVRKATGTEVTLYSGSPPKGFDDSGKWDTEQRTFFQATLPAHPEHEALSALRDAAHLRALRHRYLSPQLQESDREK